VVLVFSSNGVSNDGVCTDDAVAVAVADVAVADVVADIDVAVAVAVGVDDDMVYVVEMHQWY